MAITETENQVKMALLTVEIVGEACLSPGPLFDVWKRAWLREAGIDPDRPYRYHVRQDGILYLQHDRGWARDPDGAIVSPEGRHKFEECHCWRCDSIRDDVRWDGGSTR